MNALDPIVPPSLRPRHVLALLSCGCGLALVLFGLRPAASFEGAQVGAGAPAVHPYVQVTASAGAAAVGQEVTAHASTASCSPAAKSFLWAASAGRVVSGAGTPDARIVFDATDSPAGPNKGTIFATAVDGACAGVQGQATLVVSAAGEQVVAIPPELQDDAVVQWLGDQTLRHLVGIAFRNARAVARHAKGEPQ